MSTSVTAPASSSACGGTPSERETRLCGPREQPWYEAGSAGTSHTGTAICIDFRTFERVATPARRLTDAVGDLQGVVVTDISLGKLNDFVRGLTTSAYAVAFSIEPGGQRGVWIRCRR